MMEVTVTDAVGKKFVFVKGAPEKIISPDNREAFRECTKMAEKGLRVLAVGYKTSEESKNTVLAGVIGLADPVKLLRGDFL